MKKSLLSLVTVLATLFIFSSCNSPKKMIKNADQVGVQCTPEVLEIRNNEIVARWTANFPDGYFHKKAILKLQPVLVYQGGEVAGSEKILQGDRVADNNDVIARTGGSTSQSVKFDYKPGMERSRLELRATLLHNGNNLPFNEPFKLADGANATYMLVSSNGIPAFESDRYQPFITESKEGVINYVVNRSDVRKSELTRAEILELRSFIEEAEKDPRREYQGLDVDSYASPEGRFFVNERLSIERGKTAQEALKGLLKKDKVEVSGVVNARNTAEDWEGFRELVAQSNIQDRDLILRVLSMYSDPTTRERELRNMSKVFKILEEKILPELRRSVMVAKVEVANYTDDELKAMVSANNIESLDLEALLYAATLTNDNATKIKLYRKAADKFGDDRAFNNLAAAYLAQGDAASAKAALNSVKTQTAAVKNNLGLVALMDGNVDNAAQLFSDAGSLAAAKQNAGIVAIKRGVYDNAASALAGTGTFNEALALVLTNKLDAADSILAKLDSGKASYLRAVIAARKGNASNVSSFLSDAIAKDASLKARAQNDIEFAKFPNAI